MEGRILLDFGVTTLPSLVTKMKFAPPVSSTFVRVLGIKIHVLIKALFVSIYDSMKAHCIVKTCL